MTDTQPSKSGNSEQQFIVQRVYVKDISFEAPAAPKIFQTEWQPQMTLDLNTTSTVLDQHIHEVVLTVTVTVKNKEETAFIAEVKHAGIFTIQGFTAEQEHHFLGSFCPSILYPYAREVVTDLVSRGSFPQLILAPVNFDALYAQHLQQLNEEGAQGAKA
jgi:preprotein translocase subunit SecB